MTPRLLSLCAVTTLLAGCVTEPDVVSSSLAAETPVPSPDQLTPVDIIKLQSELTAQFPQAEAFAALAPSGEGVVFALDGTAIFVHPTFGTRIESTISGFDDNTICVAEAGSWTGICISLFQTQTGGYFCEGTFGDGGALNYPCTLNPVVEPATATET